MAKKYAIWNKSDPVITPVGEVLTAEQWIERYPVAALDSISVVCAAGEINGAFFGTLGQMVQLYEGQGADFSSAATDEEKLDVIEAFEAAAAAAAETATNEDLTATALTSIAASMEYQNLLTLDDEEGQA